MKPQYFYILAMGFAALACGCANMPTPPAQITGSYTSELEYMSYDCPQLAVEVNSLARRESQLVVAQEQRRKSSNVQAFWLGYGQGDGIEASELAVVRGEKEAVRKATENKNCRHTAPPDENYNPPHK